MRQLRAERRGGVAARRAAERRGKQRVALQHLMGYVRVIKRATQGYTGVHRGTQGYTWVHSGTQGYTRVHRGTQGYTGVHRGTQGYTGVHRGSLR